MSEHENTPLPAGWTKGGFMIVKVVTVAAMLMAVLSAAAFAYELVGGSGSQVAFGAVWVIGWGLVAYLYFNGSIDNRILAMAGNTSAETQDEPSDRKS